MAALTQVALLPEDMYLLNVSPAIIQVVQATPPTVKNTLTMTMARCQASSAMAMYAPAVETAATMAFGFTH